MKESDVICRLIMGAGKGWMPEADFYKILERVEGMPFSPREKEKECVLLTGRKRKNTGVRA